MMLWVFTCDKCNYKLTTSEFIKNHRNTKHSQGVGLSNLLYRAMGPYDGSVSVSQGEQEMTYGLTCQ